jgi:hypothetical protein
MTTPAPGWALRLFARQSNEWEARPALNPSRPGKPLLGGVGFGGKLRLSDRAIMLDVAVTMRLSDSDLRFIVETVATERRDYDHVIELVRDKPDLLEPMLQDRKLSERLISEQEAFARVSPYLLFSALLRRVWRDVERQSFVLERDDRGKRIPVFGGPRIAELLGEPDLREYLVEMLCSFVRTNTGVLYFKDRGTWRKRKFSDLDMDDMIALCHLVEPEGKPRLYKRIGDIALFLTGIYPDHTALSARRPRTQAAQGRVAADYEREARHFYSVCARQPEPPWTASIFEALAENFNLARAALNTLSDRYLEPLRERYFEPPFA